MKRLKDRLSNVDWYITGLITIGVICIVMFVAILSSPDDKIVDIEMRIKIIEDKQKAIGDAMIQQNEVNHAAQEMSRELVKQVLINTKNIGELYNVAP